MNKKAAEQKVPAGSPILGPAALLYKTAGGAENFPAAKAKLRYPNLTKAQLETGAVLSVPHLRGEEIKHNLEKAGYTDIEVVDPLNSMEHDEEFFKSFANGKYYAGYLQDLWLKGI